MAASSLFSNTPNIADSLGDAHWPGMVAASLAVESHKLAAFSRLMAQHGFALDTSRLFFDPFYAYKRLALAHTTNDDDLKALSIELFEKYKALERRRRAVSAFGTLNTVRH
jgi:hypothetical protein